MSEHEVRANQRHGEHEVRANQRHGEHEVRANQRHGEHEARANQRHGEHEARANGRRVLAQRAKRWPGWVLLVFVVVGLLAVGASRADGPSTPGERAEAIEQRIACPVCDGESVFESRNTASENIRNRIAQLVDEGALDDDEIIAVIESRFGGQVLLVPRASGFDALVWALPVAALVCALAGLAFTFRRWRREAAADVDPSEADRALVAAALASEEDAPPAERDT